MIKHVVLLTMLAACSSALSAQSFYFKVGGGYAFPFAADVMGVREHNETHLATNPETGFYDLASYDSKETVVRGTLGTGGIASLTLGYEFNDRLAAEVAFGYGMGSHYDFVNTDREIIDQETVRYTARRAASLHARNVFAAPAIKFFPGGKNLRPYVSLGPVLATSKVDTEYESYSDWYQNITSSETAEIYSGRVAIGARGGAGVEFKVGRAFYLFSEFLFTSMSYYPGKKETTKYILDGEDQLYSLSRSERFRHFVKERKRSSENVQSSGREDLQVQFNMSSVSALAGIKVTL